jgi:hypothetical protein
MSSLAEDERMQFVYQVTLGLNAVEHQFRQMRDLASDDDLEFMAHIVDFYLDTQGGREYWQVQRGVFSSPFVQWVDSHLSAQDRATTS